MSDLIVVGAGAAGLSAAVRVARAGFSVQIVEARDRIGGRIFTLRDPVCHAPVELGAEFIHGLPSEIWKPLQKYKTAIAEVTGEPWCSEDGRLSRCQFFSSVDNILKKMNCRGRDESFLSFLDRRFSASDSNKQEARRRALAYVTGFNAADPNTVGVHWLVQSMQAEEKIEGDRSFRSRNGYNDLLDIFRGELMETGVRVQTGIVVESIAWSPDHAIVRANHGRRSLQLGAKRILVTLPIGVLQAGERQPGTVQFLPGLPVNKLHAIRKMRMGKVIRATLRFRTPFWKTIRADQTNTKSLSDMNFLFTRDELFPTWWTSTPESTPLITGWAPARSAERLSGKSQAFVVDRAVHSLAAALRTRPSRLESLLDDTYCHDWQSDPFSRGAYSYGAVGSDGAQQDLARPLENTLFFAGEATDTTGHNGTVHGAIASGHRAASQILLSLR